MLPRVRVSFRIAPVALSVTSNVIVLSVLRSIPLENAPAATVERLAASPAGVVVRAAMVPAVVFKALESVIRDPLYSIVYPTRLRECYAMREGACRILQ